MFELLLLAAVAFEPCELSTSGLPLRLKASCTTVEVPVDRAQPAKTISLRVAVLKAKGRDRAEDPVFFLAGGPGQAATEGYLAVARAFSRLERTRDVVLVDQRGTGGSAPLDCRTDEVELTKRPSDEEVIAWTKECLAELEEDPRFFTTSDAVLDLDLVRERLGYKRVNLVGVSYGTRVALTYLRRFPERVRTIVLDGVVSPELLLGTTHATYLDRALELQFARCRADPKCVEAFGDLSAKLKALIQMAEQAPEVSLLHPRTGAPLTLAVDRTVLTLSLRFLAYSVEATALLPLLIAEAEDREDLGRIASQGLLVMTRLNDALSKGMELSVLCSEDVPLYGEGPFGEGTLMGETLVDVAKTQCAVWPRGTMPKDFHAPVVSPVPALLLSGELDPVTPPEQAEKVLKHLKNGRHVIVAGQGHGTIGRGCMPKVLRRFVDERTTELDLGCLDRLGPRPFFMGLTGPQP